MRTIRSFIAIPLSPPVRRAAARLVERISQAGDGVKWVPTDNLHLTLKFLGDVENTEIPNVCSVLREICHAYDPFELCFADTGGFPELARARVLYAGVEDSSGSLSAMVGKLESELADLGFKPEPRDYTPHLTLGRTRGGSRRAGSDVIDRLAQSKGVVLGSMTVDQVQMIASFRDKSGPSYQVMDTVSLDAF